LTGKHIARIKKLGPVFMGRRTRKILLSLKERPYRYAELGRNVGNSSRRMLARTLRNLEYTELIARLATRARAVEYSLTKHRRALITLLRGMCR
jgi:DNA-binding HxlR family transcriptional regulator